jgi:hypothetical protein
VLLITILPVQGALSTLLVTLSPEWIGGSRLNKEVRTFFERPSNLNAGEQLEFNEKSVVKAVFHDLYGGLSSGIAWEW